VPLVLAAASLASPLHAEPSREPVRIAYARGPGACMDAIKDGAETDVDCGGPACPTCATGKLCAVDADCTSNTCVMGVCQ
jgi:hypothetical protein